MSDRFVTILTLVGFVETGLVAMWFVIGSGRQRRSHFWLRVVVASLGLPALVAMLVVVAWIQPMPDADASLLLPVLLSIGVIGLMFVPAALYLAPAAADPSDDDDGGRGPGPDPAPSAPRPPGGGVPLRDAAQAAVRARDVHGPTFDRPKRRRREHEPARTPVRTEVR